MDSSLIANTGIQTFAFSIKINTQEKFKMWYHEWYNTESGEWTLDPVYELKTDNSCIYYKKKDLFQKGYLANQSETIEPNDLANDGITPLKVDDMNCTGITGDIFSLTFSDKENKFSCFENVWLPIPYFFKKSEKRFAFEPLNWSRVKLIPKSVSNNIKTYDVILAFDTRTKYDAAESNEHPVFPDKFRQEMKFELCDKEFLLMDFCTSGKNWSYIDEYLMSVVHPGIMSISQIKGAKTRKMSYIASYTFLMCYLSKLEQFPKITLYKDIDVETKDIDMVIDIGNSRTTALLIEDNSTFNQVRKLELRDLTDMIDCKNGETIIRTHSEPFDMRVAFRKADFGQIGSKDSKQFVYPSFVRLGQEAKHLLHLSCGLESEDSLSTYSSPKRYLWDWKPNKEEWKFLTLDEEKEEILHINGITNFLKSDGKIDPEGNGGLTFHYSRRSLMTFAFLEIFEQAKTQINSDKYRSIKTGLGHASLPRKIKRIIITCPTTMSKTERSALIECANDAAKLLDLFNGNELNKNGKSNIEIIPNSRKTGDEGEWYYDEATCSQLVYMYGEVGHKYKGACSEFFKLYGKITNGESQHTITVGSLDIGAGTSDLMISKYTYEKGEITTITPEPMFYDSYYFAGDDMLYALIKNYLILDNESAFRQALIHLSDKEYRQTMKDFFGKDYAGQTVSDRICRKNFNIQYSVPLMSYFLELMNSGTKNKSVKFIDVFENNEPNESILNDFKNKTGIDVKEIVWNYNEDKLSSIIHKEFEPLLQKIATIMYSQACDVILLSGRPASLPVIRNIFLKYYPVSPNRLIVLNNYYVGDWYPFCNNTGYISDAKTIVATGGFIGYYASELSNLNKFVINLDKLKSNLKSTVNYIEASREGLPIEYFITPEQNRGEITITTIPETLYIRQIGIDSYPCRAMYNIDFNRFKISDTIRKRAIFSGEEMPSDAKIQGMVKDFTDTLKKKMPFKLSIERDADDKENIYITSIIDKDGNDVIDGNLEIHIQSLGANDKYWLDSGEFDL